MTILSMKIGKLRKGEDPKTQEIARRGQKIKISPKKRRKENIKKQALIHSLILIQKVSKKKGIARYRLRYKSKKRDRQTLSLIISKDFLRREEC